MGRLKQLVTRLEDLMGGASEEGADAADEPRSDAGGPDRSGRRRPERDDSGRSRLLSGPSGPGTTGHPGTAIAGTGTPAVRLHGKALAAVEAFFEAARSRRQFPDELVDAAAGLVAVADELEARVRDSETMVALAMAPYPAGTSFLIPHSVNVAVLGVRVAVGAGLSAERTRTICRAGLAHDVGVVDVDQAEDGSPGTGSDHPDDAGRGPREPVRSREILEDAGPLAATARVVHHVYDRLDGEGHPGRVSGEALPLESRVLGAVDFLDAAVHPRPGEGERVGGTGSLGVQRLVKMSRAFGEDVLKGVVRGIGLFPAGTLVRLSSGEVAVVKENRPDNPMRPLVEVLEIAGGPGSGQPRTIDLVRTPHVYVSGALSATDLDELTGGRPRKSSKGRPSRRDSK